MEPLKIRKASLADLDVLLHFEQGIINAERPFDPTLKTEKTHYYDLVEMITAPHIQLLVAETIDNIIACGYARIENSKPYLQHPVFAYLGFMYVEPAFRGAGINKQIINALKDWTISQGMSEMRLEVYFGNSSAIKAYEKIGFEKHMIEMRLSV